MKKGKSRKSRKKKRSLNVIILFLQVDKPIKNFSKKLKILEEEGNRKSLDEERRYFESTLRKEYDNTREYAQLERGFFNYAMYCPPSYVL